MLFVILCMYVCMYGSTFTGIAFCVTLSLTKLIIINSFSPTWAIILHSRVHSIIVYSSINDSIGNITTDHVNANFTLFVILKCISQLFP